MANLTKKQALDKAKKRLASKESEILKRGQKSVRIEIQYGDIAMERYMFIFKRIAGDWKLDYSHKF
jgi:hypothetical protein